MRISVFYSIWLLITWLALAGGARADSPIFPGPGVALTPRNFPRHNSEDVTDMFKKGKEMGDYAVFIYQWSQPDFLNVAKTVLKLSSQHGYIPILGLSPTTLEGLRGNYDVPASVRRSAGKNLSFSNEAVHRSYIKAALDLAELKPPYLCLATEINLLAFTSIQEYIYFAHVYKKTYPLIKQISPQTKVFVSFQWDFFRILDIKEPQKIKEHSKLIDIFRPELDLIALTTYPSDHFSTPSDMPPDYYEKIYDHIQKTDEVIFMEIGWPSSGKGTEKEQLEFVKLLPTLMKGVKPKILAWSLLHDVGTDMMGADLATTGLITRSGQTKPAFKAFKELAGK